MTGIGKDGHVARVAILGAGHLGIAIAARLVREGGGEGTVVRLGNRDSALSRERAAAAGVAHLLTDVASAIDGAEVLLYTVRPTDIAMLGGYALKRDQCLISLLAGTPLARVERHARGAGAIARAMISSPDTIAAGCSIGAFHGGAGVQARALFGRLGTQVTELGTESLFDAFTAFGPCLPIALTYCEARGIAVSVDDVLEAAAAAGLGEWRAVFDWAQRVRPKGSDTRDYVERAATPGGITEAILDSLRAGESLPAALRNGVRHGATMGRS